MLVAILVAIAVLLVVLLVIAALRPAAMRVERRLTIAAPPARIYGFLDDFHAWAAWSPWEKLDPTMQRTFSGAPRGAGAIYAWQGNRKVGSGRMEITAATPEQWVEIKLDFITPFPAHNQTTLTLTPAGDATDVAWVMTGPSPFMMRVMGLFMNLDKMIGKDFESGLANLRAAATADDRSPQIA